LGLVIRKNALHLVTIITEKRQKGALDDVSLAWLPLNEFAELAARFVYSKGSSSLFRGLL